MSSSPPESMQDWRKDVTQQSRSSEVNNIAKVLASLDSSASSASKLMLASRFEDTCFKNASSLSEYRKMIVKRLKNLQKNYVPTNQPTPPVSAEAAAPNDNITFSTASESLQAAQQLQITLQKQFGNDIQTIHQYAKMAVRNSLGKYGQERATHLQQHLNNVLQWAVDLALLPDNGTTMALSEVVTHDHVTPIPIRSKVPWLLAYSAGDTSIHHNAAFLYLQQVQKHLNLRISNIKSHVLKNSNLDLFLEDTLTNIEADMWKHASPVLYLDLPSISQTDIHPSPSPTWEEIQKYMDLASAIVPIPRNKAEEKGAGIKYLKKLEACCQVYMLYAAFHFQETRIDTSKGALNYLQRAYSIAIESCNALANLSETTIGTNGVGKDLSLEDAWNKVMRYEKKPSTTETMTSIVVPEDSMLDIVDVDVDTNLMRQKHPRMDSQNHGTYPSVIRAKILAKPGRRILPPFLHALEQKEAQLECPKDGQGVARIKMTFGKAFDMYIYFSPLFVAIRAQKIESPSTTTTTQNNLISGLTSVPPISQGLGTYLDPVPNSSSSAPRPIPVLGDTAFVVHLVEKKLEFASARATCVLRQVFSEELSKMTGHLSDGDLEILEGSAMIKFLQIARTTYLNPKE